MKNFIKISALFLTLFLSFTSCEEDDSLEFVAAPQGEFEFTNTFLSEYSLPAESSTNDNIGVIFSFNPANFDVPTNVSYELQSSVLGDFSDATIVPTLSNANNQIEVSIGELKLLAEAYEIPVPGMGDLNFRVRAFVGDPISTTEKFTPIQSITVNLLEPQTGVVVNCEYDQLWLVGAGVPDAGWGWDSPVQLYCLGSGAYGANVNFASTADSNNFRFFSDATLEWDSPSFNYTYYENEGYAIDPDLVDAMDGDNNFAYIGADGYRGIVIDTINKTITLN